jgi:hypothetical protein
VYRYGNSEVHFVACTRFECKYAIAECSIQPNLGEAHRAKERVVAVALLTQRQVDQLGSSLQQLWPVQDVPCFKGLLNAIDDADRSYWQSVEKGCQQ